MDKHLGRALKMAKREACSIFIAVTYYRVEFSTTAPRGQDRYFEVRPDGTAIRYTKNFQTNDWTTETARI